MPPRLSPIERVLRAFVRLLPPEFRSDFGDAIHADLADRRASGDRSGLLRRELPSLAAAVAREHASTLAQDAKYALRTIPMLAVAAFAVYLPVRRATSVDPVIALRFE